MLACKADSSLSPHDPGAAPDFSHPSKVPPWNGPFFFQFSLSGENRMPETISQAHQQEAAIFDAVIDLPLDQRAAHLDRACRGDAGLRQRIEALLKANESRGAFVDSPAEPTVPMVQSQVFPTSFERAGDRIGRYKLLQQIGEGGCGVVYMAEQEEPVRRRVALKVIKLGLDTKSVIARFEAERQALALMDHPNIAKVFDAGATESGRPYFVMELVRGLKITEYCDEAKLSTRARLELFIQVCSAIQHAHQKGIIHRDIKPSNILVTLNDCKAVPKVIDFGVAKATGGQRLTERTLFTVFEQFIGTPAYMSPEQVMLTSMDIDTRSDIYALGVLLYELLTGRTPFNAKELLAIGLDEMRRTIREEEPARPSTCLSTLPGQELGTTAQRRGLDAPKLVSELRGDLDWIAMKALEKDRSRRYETANGLAMDVQRHLDNEPVLARPPGSIYRFGKWVRRNKLAFSAGLAVAAALVIGLTGTTWMFLRERSARREQAALRREADISRAKEVRLRNEAQAGEKKAAAEAAKSETVAEFLKQMLHSIRPSVALGRDTSLIREVADQTAERVAKDLADQPSVQAELLATLGDVYRALGRRDDAERILRKVVALRQDLLGKDDPAVARALNDLALVIWQEGEGAGTERFLEEARARRQIVVNDYSPPDPNSNERFNGWERAEPLHRRALKIRRMALRSDDLEATESLNNLALVLRRKGELDQAEALQREALATRRNIFHEDDLRVAASLHNLGVVLRDQGKLAKAEASLREALGIRRRLLGMTGSEVSQTVHNLADVLQRRSDPAGVESLFRDELANAITRPAKNPGLGSDPLYQILDVLMAHEEFDVVDALILEPLTSAIERERGNVGLWRIRAETLARRGRWKEAAADMSKVIELNPEDHDPWYFLAHLHLRNGAIDAYRQHCEQMLKRFGRTKLPVIAERTAKACLLIPESGLDLRTVGELAQNAVIAGSDDSFAAYYWFAKGLAEYRLGNHDGAEEWLRKSLELDGNNIGIPARMVLAMNCQRLHKTENARYALVEAASWAEEVWPAQASDYGGDWHDILMAHGLLAEAKALIGEDALTDKQPGPSLRAAMRLGGARKQAEAEAAFREVLARYKELFGADHPLIDEPLFGLSFALAEQQKWVEAEAGFRELTVLREKLDDKHGLIGAFRFLGLVLGEQKKAAEAEGAFKRGLTLSRQYFAGPDRVVDDLLFQLSIALRVQGKLSESEAIRREELELERELSGDASPFVDNSLWSLASVLREEGKLEEAEILLRDRLAEIRQHGANKPAQLSAPASNLADALIWQHKLDEAEQVLSEVLGPESELDSGTVELLRVRGKLRARRGQWEKAIADVRKAKEAKPEDHGLWHELSGLLVAAGQIDNYREHCRQSVARFGTTKDSYTAERIARDCLILPESGVDLEVLQRMTTFAAVTNHNENSRFQLAKGLAEYRQGHFEGAIASIEQVLATDDNRIDRKVEAYMVLAMTHHHLQQIDEARAAFAKGSEIERDKMPKLESGDLGDRWQDWVITHALMREARELLDGPVEAKAANK
jgi:serine/threonine protein kinase/tetratricopeptide (TPR) repeat protein